MSIIDGFRLGAPSECSMRSKARIDALFEDSRSVCSSSLMTGPSWPNCYAEDDQRRVNSAVQARIEAMFASVEAEDAAPGECAAAVLPVKYMGAAPVGGRVASVKGLQEPLRQLAERIGDSVNAELEVSKRGLTFRTSELHEKTNPFRRIAVWSALKLMIRRRPNSSDQRDVLHAFVPLVADERAPGSPQTNSEDRHAELYRTMRGLARDVEDYPPIFAVVMRRPGAARLLECHAFACRCEEDAIAAAATLYRALLADLDAQARRPRQRNGLGCVSLASVASSVREGSTSARSRCTELHFLDRMKQPPPPPPPPPTKTPTASQPVRPPRAKKTSMSSSANTEDELSTSSPGACGGAAGGPTRRKKMNSDVKAEDVLEARSRRLLSQAKESSAAGSKGLKNNNSEKSTSSASSNSERTKEERRMNAKNKVYGTRGTQTQASGGKVRVIEKIYDERKPNGAVQVCNENDRSSSDPTSSSCEFECCTENSLYESSRIYAKACAGAKSESRSYDVTKPSNRSTPSRSSSVHRETYSVRHPDEVSIAPAKQQQQQRRRSIAGSVAGETIARHRDHFRDADKICSLGAEEEAPKRDSRRNSSASREDRVYDVTRPSRTPCRQTQPEPPEQAAARSSKRSTPVTTMDRPLRRPTVPPPPQPQQPPTRRPQQQQQQQPHQRRRSRAGSEPPCSRTEATAAAISAAAILKRSQSDMELGLGDPLTRVELPRRGSFLKPGSVRRRDGPEGGGGGTPLGFSELFDEFRNQEGLTSVDDILAAIIDPEGMSFNELKPLYKEFLLKLAGTLTQDELYQRSASIMRRRRRPQRRRSSRGRAGLLRRAIKRSVSRLRGAGGAPTEFTSVVFPARRLNERSSFGSSSSCDAAARNGHGHHRSSSGRVLASKLGKRRSTTRCGSSKSRPGHTTSEDSDTCRRMGRNAVTANRSSSGYVSCSECSYDSESCTCVSADKCYCSLSRASPRAAGAEPSATLCSCDTDSCSESNKCYCAGRAPQSLHRRGSQQQPSILEQLRQKGIVPSESTLSRNPSPERARSRRPSKNLASSKSLEYLKVRSSSMSGSTDRLALDYDLFRPGGGGRRSSQCSSGSEKVLVVSARDPQGRLIYVGGTERDVGPGGRSARRGSGSRRRHADSAGHHEALSIKKSAEIAAVFAGQSRLGRRASSLSSFRSSVSLEAGLGYLP